MAKNIFKLKKIKMFLNAFYIKHKLPIINRTHDEGDCISDDEITIAF